MVAIAFRMLYFSIIDHPCHFLLYVLIMKTPAEGYQHCPVIRGQGRGSCIRGKVCWNSKGLCQSFVVTTAEIWSHLRSKSCWPPCCYGTSQIGFFFIQNSHETKFRDTLENLTEEGCCLRNCCRYCTPAVVSSHYESFLPS